MRSNFTIATILFTIPVCVIFYDHYILCLQEGIIVLCRINIALILIDQNMPVLYRVLASCWHTIYAMLLFDTTSRSALPLSTVSLLIAASYQPVENRRLHSKRKFRRR